MVLKHCNNGYRCKKLKDTRTEFFCDKHQVHLAWILREDPETKKDVKHPMRAPNCTGKVI